MHDSCCYLNQFFSFNSLNEYKVRDQQKKKWKSEREMSDVLMILILTSYDEFKTQCGKCIITFINDIYMYIFYNEPMQGWN